MRSTTALASDRLSRRDDSGRIMQPVTDMRSTALLLFAAGVALAQPPRIVSKTEPSYTEEALRARVHSTVRVSLLINADGAPEDIRVTQGAGFGLDEKAVEAVSAWRFDPGRRQSVAVASRNTIEVTFRLLSEAHFGQTARLNFTLPPGASRPELIAGIMPANRDNEASASFKIALSVTADGTIAQVSVLQATSQEWADQAEREMRSWRFRPASLKGQGIEVKGVFELSRGAAAPGVAAPPQRLVSILLGDPVDPALSAPHLVSPADGAVFDTFPRSTTFQWEPSPGADSYILEWDYGSDGVWNAEANRLPELGYPVRDTQFSFDFVGAQIGRWRVWPVGIAGRRGATPSEWRTFRYTR
jgi:TonB family protein